MIPASILHMPRLLLTFRSLRQVISANQILRDSDQSFRCRVTPIPPALEHDICGMAVELLAVKDREPALKFLANSGVEVAAVHEVPD
jgi:hypothetical protein